MSGCLTTVEISVGAAILGTALGFGLCMLRSTKKRALHAATTVYIRILQGTPLLVLLMIMYYLVFAKSGVSGTFVAIIAAQTVFEELCVQTVLARLSEPDMRVTIEYSEKSGHAQLRVYYNGGFDASAGMDDLSSKLVENVSVETEYMPSDNKNYTDCVKVKLK